MLHFITWLSLLKLKNEFAQISDSFTSFISFFSIFSLTGGSQISINFPWFSTWLVLQAKKTSTAFWTTKWVKSDSSALTSHLRTTRVLFASLPAKGETFPNAGVTASSEDVRVAAAAANASDIVGYYALPAPRRNFTKHKCSQIAITRAV